MKANYDIDFIKFLVEKHYSLTDIADILGVSKYNLYPICSRNGIQVHNEVSNRLTWFQTKMVVDLYKEGESSALLADKFNVSQACVLYILKNLGIKIRDSNDKLYKNCKINLNAFSDVNEESCAYFYGLLLADGCLTKNKSGDYHRVSISLKSEDGYILQRMLNYIGYDNGCNIKYSSNFDSRTNNTYEKCYAYFNDSTIVERLVSYGFSPRKSLNEVLPENGLEKNRHFWRGIIDGDGGVYLKNNNPKILIVGSSAIVNGFLKFCRESAGITINYKVACRKNLYSTEICGRNARLVAEVLYSDCNLYLKRKHCVAVKLIEGLHK